MKKQVGNVQLMQKINRLKVLNYIRENPSVSRLEITKKTGLSVASLTNITSYLLEKNLLLEDGVEEVSRVGRKTTLLKFNGDGYSLVCVSVLDSGIFLYHTNLCGKIMKEESLTFDETNNINVSDVLLNRLADFLTSIDCTTVLGIGVFVSGVVLDDGHKVVSASLKWNEYDLVGAIQSITYIPVFVDNVTQLKAISYYCTERKEEHSNSVFVDMENGIGSVHFYQGALNRSFLGEIGHITVDKDGLSCFCGNKGCLEMMCSAKRMIALYYEKTGQKISISLLQQQAEAGEQAACEVIDSCAEYLGMTLANMVNLLAPKELVFDAGDFRECPRLIHKALQVMNERAYQTLVQDVTALTVTLSGEEMLVGMSANLCNRIFDINFENHII